MFFIAGLKWMLLNRPLSCTRWNNIGRLSCEDNLSAKCQQHSKRYLERVEPILQRQKLELLLLRELKAPVFGAGVGWLLVHLEKCRQLLL